MLKKLFNGEYPLRATFWKFGIFGMVILYYAYKMLKSLAGNNINGYNLLHIIRNLSIDGFAKINAFWLIAYCAVSVFLVIYSYGVTKAVFKTAEAYEKSSWLAGLARIGILATVALTWYMIIYG